MVQFKKFRLKNSLEALFIRGDEGVFSLEQVDKFERDFQFYKFFDVVMVLIDGGSDVVD